MASCISTVQKSHPDHAFLETYLMEKRQISQLKAERAVTLYALHGD
jgi:hypothetical protein